VSKNFSSQQICCTPSSSHFSAIHQPSSVMSAALWLFCLQRSQNWSLSQNLDGRYLPEVKFKWSFLNEYFCTCAAWVQILNWQLILNVGIVHQVIVCAEELPLYVSGAFLNKTTTKNFLFLFTETWSQILKTRTWWEEFWGANYQLSKEGSQRWKTTDKATPFHRHSSQPPFIRAVNMEQKKMDFLLPSKRIKQ